MGKSILAALAVAVLCALPAAGPAEAGLGGYYQVGGVAEDDMLKMRAGPGIQGNPWPSQRHPFAHPQLRANRRHAVVQSLFERGARAERLCLVDLFAGELSPQRCATMRNTGETAIH